MAREVDGQLLIRVSRAERKALNDYAVDHNTTVSEMLREALARVAAATDGHPYAGELEQTGLNIRVERELLDAAREVATRSGYPINSLVKSELWKMVRPDGQKF